VVLGKYGKFHTFLVFIFDAFPKPKHLKFYASKGSNRSSKNNNEHFGSHCKIKTHSISLILANLHNNDTLS